MHASFFPPYLDIVASTLSFSDLKGAQEDRQLLIDYRVTKLTSESTMMSNTNDTTAAPPKQDELQELPEYAAQWKRTWHDFKRALYSPRPFHQWDWIHQLVSSASKYIVGISGLQSIVSVHQPKQFLHSFLPLFGLSLIAFIWWSYLTTLRPMLRQEWCTTNESSCLAKDRVHSSIVVYWVVMITWHFIVACFSSPGVALPKEHSTIQYTWKARSAQGGFCGLNPPFCAAEEVQRVALYGTLDQCRAIRGRPPLPANDVPWEFPLTNPSYCEKCDIIRPPRCHHCKVCNRCTLQADHHCPWLNNCIGFNNYRSFLLLICHVFLASVYGVGLLLPPFYKTISNQISQHGIKYFYKNKTGFLDLPMPRVLWQQWKTTGIDDDVMLRMVFPLLVLICSIMIGFVSIHVYYVVTARTTLEHTIMLYILKDKLKEEQQSNHKSILFMKRPTNPFSQGWKANIHQVLGPNLFLVLLPIPVTAPRPYIPNKKIE